MVDAQHSIQRPKRVPPGELVGESNEVEVDIEGTKVLALLDTGSSVSTVCQSFYERHLKHLPLSELQDVLEVECADGQLLPYAGYIVADIVAPGAGLKNSDKHLCLLLVIPDSRYNAKVPLLLGTNVLGHLSACCREQNGNKFLQVAKLHTAWYLSFRCLAWREKELTRRQRLGVIRNAESQRLVIKPNSSVVIRGMMDKGLDVTPTCALIQPVQTHCNLVTANLDITPSLVNYQPGQKGIVDVHVSNITTQTVVVPPRTVLCELQPVTLAKQQDRAQAQFYTADSESFMDKIKISSEVLSEEEIVRLESLLQKYEDGFSKNDLDVGYTR